ncbi:peptidoglycan DD-metalloendopeptidase family protein [Dokdonella sp.]|uniref:murein hydrolase activator EnvC family protein n=1 Tax=Dokdonella sp. TaxID=2291710 RepID=UPI0025BD02C0|nr:peptidoglycan DD-metalloendopeptidase family protein [Dokdonella sp.]MBX3691279.1 peptidoglycan DD-metalloendopeptidase family protein [Dokdonella sp.]
MRIGFLAGVLLTALGAAVAQPDDPAARAAQEHETKQKLDAVREQIRALAEQQRATSGEHAEAARALREQELAIDDAAKSVRALDERLSGQQDELAALEERRAGLARALETQREALAALLRSAYALGRDEEIKLLLQQDDVGAIARVLAYHRYFQGARVERIDALMGDLEQLAEVQRAIVGKNADVVATRKQQLAEVARLEAGRAERAALLATLDAALKDQQARLATLGRDERGLVDLLGRLRDVFADIPKQLSGAEPFADQRGRLPWPLKGTLRIGFGGRDAGGRQLSGLLIGADAGVPVHAVARGRVAYADWLKGYGMLLILDHGDGWMSLYGANESLLKDVGDWVAAGEVIAQSGASGGQSTPGLYFELRRQGKAVDPKPWLRK